MLPIPARQKVLYGTGHDGNIENNYTKSGYWATRSGAFQSSPPERAAFNFVTSRTGSAVGNPLSPDTKRDVTAIYNKPEFMSGRRLRGSGILLETHVDHCIPDNANANVTLVSPANAGTGDDAKVWGADGGAAKLANIAWRIAEAVNNVGNYVIYISLQNEPDGNPNRCCAVGTAGTTVAPFSNGSAIDETTFVSRLVAIQKAAWNELRSPQRSYNLQPRDGIALITSPLSEDGKRGTRASHLATTFYGFLGHNNGEVMNYANGVGFHFYDRPVFAWRNTSPGDTVSSLYHVWKAVQQAQTASGNGARHFVVCNEGGSNERMMVNTRRTAWNHALTSQQEALGNKTEAWDAANAPAHAALLPARRREKAWRIGGLAYNCAAYAVALWVYYSYSGSPHDSMVLAPDYEGFAPREIAWNAYKYFFDWESYRVTGPGPWTLPLVAKPFRDATSNVTLARIGYHDMHNGMVVHDYGATISDPMGTLAPWYEWRRATFSNGSVALAAPVSGQGAQENAVAWCAVLPGHATYSVQVAYSGNTGTVRLRAIGYNYLNGLATQVATATAAAGTLTITFTGMPHMHPRVPAIPRVVIQVESTAAATFGAPVIAGA